MGIRGPHSHTLTNFGLELVVSLGLTMEPCSVAVRLTRPIVVVPLLVLLAFGVAGGVFIASDSGERTPPPGSELLERARLDVASIAEGAEAYRADLGECPLEVLDLVIEGYLDDAPSVDPWGHDYRLDCAGESVSARSAGPDGQSGTPDDVASSSLP